MRKYFILFFLSFLLFESAISQILFQRVYSNIGKGKSIQQTFDGGFIISGNYNLPKGFLIKTDMNLNILWAKTFGGNNKDFNSVIQTSDSGYMVVGTKYLSDNSSVFIMRTNSQGDTLWTKSYGGIGYDSGNSVKQTPDGGFIIAGKTGSYAMGSGGSDAYIIKTDANGDTLWTKTFVSDYTSSAIEIQNTFDSGFIFTGSASDGGFYQAISIIKMDSNGDTIWTKAFSAGSLSDAPVGKSIIETKDSCFIILGVSENYSATEEAYILKINAMGDTLWTKSFNVLYNHSDFGKIIQANDGGFVVAGSGGLDANPQQVYHFKFDTNGNLIWVKIYFETSYFNSKIYEIKQTNDGGYIFIGQTESYGGGTLLVKTDSLGNNTCNNSGLPVNFYPTFFQISSGATVGSGGNYNSNSTTLGTLDTANVNPCLPIPEICVVTVDSATQRNKVVLDMNIDTTLVDSYNIYKETTTSNVYSLIGNVFNSSFIMFIDNASNPAQKAERYKISTVDSQGIESYTKSLAHKTIHLSVNLGNPPQINLIWDNYEGFSVSKYRIWRGNGNGVSLIDSVQGSLNSYTDMNPPLYDTIYFIEAIHPTGCNSSFSNGYASTKSNQAIVYKTSGFAEIAKNNFVLISPNPSNGQFSINFNTKYSILNTQIIIYNTLGEAVYKSTVNHPQSEINLGENVKGIYLLQIKSSSFTFNRKLIFE